MNIEEFDWREEILLKIETKHNVRAEEVEESAFGRPHVRRAESGIYYLYGRTEAGRYLFVVFRHLGRGVIRPITARDMNEAQRRLYRKATGGS